MFLVYNRLGGSRPSPSEGQIRSPETLHTQRVNLVGTKGSQKTKQENALSFTYKSAVWITNNREIVILFTHNSY